MADSHAAEFTPHRLDNPLFRHYSEIDDAARTFATTICADEALCIKAARIACDPPTWESVEGLTDQERRAFGHELQQGFWSQPKSLRATVLILCFSAIVQGWVQSVSNGASQTLPQYLNLRYDEPDNHAWVDRAAIWKFAALNCVIYLIAGLCGCWCSDPLQSSILGRRGAIFASGCLCIIASIGSAAVSNQWWHLLIWRSILGIGLGAKASVTPIFGAEISPPHLRGKLVMNWQLFDAFGILCGFSANLVCYKTGRLAWRYQYASACLPALALVLMIWTIPESPRWLLKRGRGPQAFASLCALRETPLQAAAELFFASAQLQREIDYIRKKEPTPEMPLESYSDNPDTSDRSSVTSQDVSVQDVSTFESYRDAVKSTSYWGRIAQLFRNPRTRRATVAASVVMIGQQLCGTNVLQFYSTLFIQNIDRTTDTSASALWLSWGLGLTNFLCAFPAYWWIDRYGRRYLLLATYPGMILSLLAASLSFPHGAGTDAEKGRQILVVVFFFLLMVFSSLGQGPVPFTYSAEVFPLLNREAGMSFAVFVNLVGAGLLTLLVPQAQVSAADEGHSNTPPSNSEWLSHQAQLVGIFAGLCTLSMFLIYLFVPETKLATAREDQKRTLNYISLEELNQIFTVPTREVWRFHLCHVGARTVHNVLVRLRLRSGEYLHIEDSMHFWSEDRLDRRKSEPRWGKSESLGSGGGIRVSYEEHE